MQTNVEVLRVDDNPMVVRMLRDALRSLAKVAPGADRDRAPDLLAGDSPMPPIEPRQLAEKLRIPEPVSGLSVIPVAAGAVPEKRAAQDHAAGGLGRIDRAQRAACGGCGEEDDVLLDS